MIINRMLTHMFLPRSLSAAAAITATVLVCAACGGSSSKSSAGAPVSTVGAASSSAGTGSGSGTSSTSASATGSASASGSAAARPSAAKLKSFNLVQADLGATWTSKASNPSDNDDPAGDAALAACTGTKNTDPDKVTETASPDFTLQETTISSSATSYKSQSDLDADIAEVKSPKASACFNQLLRKNAASGLQAGETLKSLVFKLVPGNGGGPSNVIAAVEGQLTFLVNGKTVTAYEDSALITGTLTEAEVDFEGIGARVPAADRARLTNLVATRVSKG
jgi:hypothetical protein